MATQTNAFDDLPPLSMMPVPPVAAPLGPNAFDDITPPPRAAERQLPPATAADRTQAFESGVWRGGSYLAGMVPDAAANIWNLGKAVMGMESSSPASAAARAAVARAKYRGGQLPESTAAPVPSALEVNSGPSPIGAKLAEALDRYHDYTPTTIDRPDDAASRYLSAAGSVLPGAAVGSGGTIGGTLTAALSATPSALAGQAVTDAHPFKSDWANTLASAGTQMGVSAGVPMLTKALLRGPSGDQMQANAAAFREAGAEPSVGQASGVRRTQFLESMLAKIPGGAGVFHKFAGQQASDLGEGAQSTVAGLSSNVSPEAAGEAITQGVKGPGGAVDQFRQQSQDLFNAVDRHVPGNQPVPVANTLAALDKLTATIPGAESVSATLVNPKIAGIRDAVLNDLTKPGATGQGDVLPYTALSRVRSQVGDMIGGNELISGIPRAQLKQLYGALSEDMKGAAQSAGPQAAAAWNKAQDHYRTNIDRMDQLSNLIDKQGGPEAIYRSALAGTNFGASRLRTILNSVGPDQRNTVAATVLDRMGKATAGAQNAEGSAYSPQTFLTNWNKMAPEAKDALFGAQGSALRNHLENTARVAESIKSGSKVFANPSGTAAAENQTEMFKHAVSLAAGALLGHGGGSPGTIAGAGAALVGVPSTAYLLSKALTSPTAVNWAGRPAIGSSAQAASLSAAPANLTEQERNRQRLMNALNHINSRE